MVTRRHQVVPSLQTPLLLRLAALWLLIFGVIVTSARAQTASYTAVVTTLASSFTFNTPYGIAVDSSGNVYVADYGNNAVKEIVAAVGNSQWFVQLLERLGHEVWIGDASQTLAPFQQGDTVYLE